MSAKKNILIRIAFHCVLGLLRLPFITSINGKFFFIVDLLVSRQFFAENSSRDNSSRRQFFARTIPRWKILRRTIHRVENSS